MDSPEERLTQIEGIGQLDLQQRLEKLVEVEAELRSELGSPSRDEQSPA